MSPKKNTARDVEAHQKRLAELADRIVAFAKYAEKTPSRVSRAEFEAAERTWLLDTQ